MRQTLTITGLQAPAGSCLGCGGRAWSPAARKRQQQLVGRDPGTRTAVHWVLSHILQPYRTQRGQGIKPPPNPEPCGSRTGSCNSRSRAKAVARGI